MPTKTNQILTMLVVVLPVLAQVDATIASSPAEGIGPEAGVMRRDPSDVILVSEQFYVWYASDGLTISKWQDLKSVPHAAGLYRPEAFTDTGNGAAPAWGVHIGEKKRALPSIERITFDWKSVTPPHNAAP